LGEIPPEEHWRRKDEFDPEWEAEKRLAEQGEVEALIDAALEDEVRRWEHINMVRIANGQRPKPRPKRWRLTLRYPTGRDG
jgi:hypothetical protein